MVGRTAADDIYCAGNGVLAEKRWLWPAQNLDPLQIDQRHAAQLVAPVIDAVDEHCHGLFEALVVARGDAANGNAVCDGRLGDLEIGDRRRDRFQIGLAIGLDRFTGNCRNRNRNVGKPLFAFLRRDNNDVQTTGILDILGPVTSRGSHGIVLRKDMSRCCESGPGQQNFDD